MSFLSYNLKGLVATLSVSPAPSTLADSAAILRKLQRFGRVNYFKKLDVLQAKPKHDRDSAMNRANHLQRYKVIFSDQDNLQNALSESPFTVAVNENVPNPQDLDPYNIRGLQLRKQLQFQKYSCHIEPSAAEDSEEEFSRAIFHGRFKSKHGYAGRLKLQEELAEAKAPLSLVEGLAISLEDAEVIEPEVKRTQSLDESILSALGADIGQDESLGRSTDNKASSDTSHPDLMAMYKRGLDPNYQSKVDWHFILRHNPPTSTLGERKRLTRDERVAQRLAELQKEQEEQGTSEFDFSYQSQKKDHNDDDPFGQKG